MTRTRYKVGSGGSKLALKRTRHVVELLRSFDPGMEFSIEIIRSPERSDLGGDSSEGVRAAELAVTLEHALAGGRIDIIVHAVENLPIETLPGLTIAAVTARLDPREALISQHGETIDSLPVGCRIGANRPRRRLQLNDLRSDLNFSEFRSDLETRIRKVRLGEFQAAVTSCASMIRLGLTREIADIFPLETLVPAPGQGALAIQCRHDDLHCFELVELVNHDSTAWSVLAERAVVRSLGLDTMSPIGVSASFPHSLNAQTGDRSRRQMLLRAVSFDAVTGKPIRAEATGQPRQWHELAEKVAQQLGSVTTLPGKNIET